MITNLQKVSAYRYQCHLVIRHVHLKFKCLNICCDPGAKGEKGAT